MTCNTLDSPSTKFSDLALTPEQLEAKIKSFGVILAEDQNPALKYDTSFLNSAINTITQLVNGLPPSYVEVYPELVGRVNAAPITPAEIAEFIDTTGATVESVTYIINAYDPDTTTTPLPITTETFLNELNTFYTENFGSSISNGFCSTFNGILTKLAALMAAFKLAQSKINEILGQFKSLTDLLEGLVDKIKEKMMSIVNGLKAKIAGYVNMAKQFGDKLRDIANFFSPENMQKLKDKIKSFITGIAGKFEQLTPEVLLYLLFRFCQLTNIIEQFMKAPIQGLQDMILRHEQTLAIFSNMSNSAKLNAVLAGAFRMDTSTIDATKRKIADQAARNATPTGTVKPSVYYTKPFEKSEVSEALRIITGNGEYNTPYFNFEDVLAEEDGIKTVNMLKVDILIVAMRIAKRMGKKFYVISAYRSPKKNAKTKGAAKSSLHMSGLALDIAWGLSGITTAEEREKFIQIASQEGIGGIGTYKGAATPFIHIDVGPRRTWPGDTSDYTTSGTVYDHARARALHAADRFRHG